MSAADEHVVTAIRTMLAASPATSDQASCLPSEAELVMRSMLHKDHVRLYLDYFRPVVKTLVERSASLAQPAWQAVLDTLAQLLTLRETELSWVYRAFVIKLLPSMAMMMQHNAPSQSNLLNGACNKNIEADMSHARAQAVGATLLRCAVPHKTADTATAAEDRNELQLRRVALTSLLTLPAAVVEGVVCDLVRALPDSQQACVALLLNPSTPDSTRRVFAKCFSASSTSCKEVHNRTSSDDKEGGATEKERRSAAARAAVEAALRQSYAAYETVHTELLCERLANSEASMRTKAGLTQLQREVLQPLVRLCTSPSATAASQACLRQCLTVPLLCHLFALLWLRYEEEEAEKKEEHVRRQYDDAVADGDGSRQVSQPGDVVGAAGEQESQYGDVVLACARDLVELRACAAPVSTVGITDAIAAQLHDFVALLTPYMPETTTTTTTSSATLKEGKEEQKAVATLPMPLLECFLLLAERALPLLLSSSPVHCGDVDTTTVTSRPNHAHNQTSAPVVSSGEPHALQNRNNTNDGEEEEGGSKEDERGDSTSHDAGKDTPLGDTSANTVADHTSHTSATVPPESQSRCERPTAVLPDFVRVMRFLHSDVLDATEEVLWRAEQDLLRRRKLHEGDVQPICEPQTQANNDDDSHAHSITTATQRTEGTRLQPTTTAASHSVALLVSQIAVIDAVCTAIRHMWHVVQRGSRAQVKGSTQQLTPSWGPKPTLSSDSVVKSYKASNSNDAVARHGGATGGSVGNSSSDKVATTALNMVRDRAEEKASNGGGGHVSQRRAGRKRRRR